ncbi:unnamed protein product, partial [Closterium sp. NIES-53]
STASTTTASSAAASTASTSAAASTTTVSAAAATTTTTTTSATSPAATPTPSAAPAATATATSSSTRTLAPLALAGATSPTRGRRRAGRLETKQVGSSSRGNRGQQGGRRAPLKDGGARVTTRSSYSDYALLRCEEGLLEEVDGEGGGTDCEKVVPDDAKGVREAHDYVVESDVHGGWVLSTELSRKGGAVASVTSAEVRNECSSGRGGVARNYSVVQGLSTLVLTKMRTLRGREVATHSKTCSSIAGGPLRADSGISISSRSRRGARGEIKERKAVSPVAL